MNRVTRLDEQMAAMSKPALMPSTSFRLGLGDCLVLCGGFEDRAMAVLRDAASRSSAFRVVVIAYAPAIAANRLTEIRATCAQAGIAVAEIVYDRENPAWFGDVFLRQLEGTEGRVVLDISGMSRLLIVQCLVAMRARKGGFVNCAIAYAEAETYPPTPEEVEDAVRRSEDDPLSSFFLLSSGVFEVTVVPELSASTVGPNQTRLVAFPSFSPEQIMALKNELSPSRCTYFHGLPPREENRWRTEAIARINRLAMSDPDSVMTSTMDYRETLDCLLRLYGEHSERERLIVSPTGSKMQTVAVGLFRAALDDVQIVYPTPREFRAPDNYTRGIRQIYSLSLDPFAPIMHTHAIAPR